MTEFKAGDIVIFNESNSWNGGRGEVVGRNHGSDMFTVKVRLLELPPDLQEHNHLIGGLTNHRPKDLLPYKAPETRTTSSTGAEKGVKPARFDLLPAEALAKVAEHYGLGAEKYVAHNWRKGYEWSKSYAALQRHANAFWQGEDNDPEFGTPHMAAVVFHALTLLTFMDEQPGFDDRYRESAE